MTKPYNEFSIVEAAKALRAKECTVRELWDACVSVANEKNPELNAYLEIFSRDDAAIGAAQARIDSEGEKAPLLCGIPLAVKDNILLEGRVASAASKMLQNYSATYSATVIRKLKEQGALFLGRTNMDEFALGGSTENSAFGVTKNPHDLARVAGGTSGGSAAAVAANMCIAALGTDTGGSVRNPASYCGVVGMKPTYGAVSRSGVIAAASSFDQVGPITKTVEDAAIVFSAIEGHDPLDSTSITPTTYPKSTKEVKTIGVPTALFAGALPESVSAAFWSTLEKLEKKGIQIIRDIDLPNARPALAAYYIINFAEVSTNLSRFDGVRYGDRHKGETLLDDYVLSRTLGFGKETKRRILLGTYVLSAGYIDAYYRKAERARVELRKDFTKAFETVDAIAVPTMPTPAFRIGEKADPLSLYLEDVFTITANLTGMPALSVPMEKVEWDGASLPAGIQFTTPHGAHERLFTLGSLAAE